MDAENRPVAYFITIRTYGTWLHGDPRGSDDRHHNRYGRPYLDHNPARKQHETNLLRQPAVNLVWACRQVVDAAFRELCRHRGWPLHALNVRSNHAHAVVSAPCAPEKVMNDLKAWGTRRLREAGLFPPEDEIWSYHGSTEYLWDDSDLCSAMLYVCERQNRN